MNAPSGQRLGKGFEGGFRLEALRIDSLTGEVTGPGGREQLDPKVMDALLLMAERAGQVVSREELYERLWPDSVVTDDALTRCFSELRRQLSRAGGDERYRALFETLPKRGYRLNASVVPLEPANPVASPPRTKRAWYAAAAALLATAAILVAFLAREPLREVSHSIAVLPFVDMSEARDQGYFADGVAEEILNRLTKAGGLRVISRTSSFSFRDQALDVSEIAGRLGVTHVLEGSVRRSGDRIRITAQLIAASDRSHLWSETYDREVDAVFAVQDEIAQSVADALRVTLAPGASPKPPANPAAYERYLAGRLFHERRGVGDPLRAVEALEEAVVLDPGYATAWAALSGAYMVAVDEGAAPEKLARERQLAAALESIRLEPDLSAGHERLAQYHFETGDFDRAREAYAQALRLRGHPSADLTLRLAFSYAHDDLELAIAEAREKVSLDPVSAVSHMNLGVMLFAAGHLAQARETFVRATELSPTLLTDASEEIARVLLAERRFEEAYAASMQLPAGDRRDHVLALLYDASGRREEAEAALARLAADGDSQAMHMIRLAEAHALRGRKDEAFAALARFPQSLDAQDPRRPTKLWWFRQEAGLAPFLAPLHGDPRWRELMSAER